MSFTPLKFLGEVLGVLDQWPKALFHPLRSKCVNVVLGTSENLVINSDVLNTTVVLLGYTTGDL